MSTVKEIEAAITELSSHDLEEFRAWFAEFESEAWDRQIEEDAQNGRLEAFYQSLQHENEGQPDIPLNAVLDQEKLS